MCLTHAGHGNHVLQKILPEQLHHGVPPQDYLVRRFGHNSDIRMTGKATKTTTKCALLHFMLKKEAISLFALKENLKRKACFGLFFWSRGLFHPFRSFHLHRLTCAYLSCKVDEFNVSSTQFVGNLVQESPAGQERVLEQILEYELLLIQQLNFHLVVHNPYRPLEGLLIDLKVV